MSAQNELRDELCKVLLNALHDERVNIVEATVACMGAAAIVMACLPPRAREELAIQIDGKLLETANLRAQQILSGEFDQLQAGH